MIVRTANYHECSKTFRLSDKSIVATHRYGCLGEGDEIERRGRGVIAVCRNGNAQILPAYSAMDAVEFGRHVLTVRVKEPTAPEEIAGYHKLEDYHYRGKVLHGRRVPLIAQSSDPLVPGVLGYVELSTSFMMSRPRAELFNSPFAFDSIKWKSWDKAAVRRYTNVVVRIARCVVSPEFRGLSLAQLLVKHAARFARSHWHVGKLKPLFMEITADMLRYVPFVERAGMHYIGDTEGNLKRVRKDMTYILANLRRVKQREILQSAAPTREQTASRERERQIAYKTPGTKSGSGLVYYTVAIAGFTI